MVGQSGQRSRAKTTPHAGQVCKQTRFPAYPSPSPSLRVQRFGRFAE